MRAAFSDLLLSNQTEDYRGGWSLYEGEVMGDFQETGLRLMREISPQ